MSSVGTVPSCHSASTSQDEVLKQKLENWLLWDLGGTSGPLRRLWRKRRSLQSLFVVKLVRTVWISPVPAHLTLLHFVSVCEEIWNRWKDCQSNLFLPSCTLYCWLQPNDVPQYATVGWILPHEHWSLISLQEKYLQSLRCGDFAYWGCFGPNTWCCHIVRH